MESKINYRLKNSESRFLKGLKSRIRELLFTFKVQYYFINGFRKMHFIGPCITVFGSGRFNLRTDKKDSIIKPGLFLI